MSLILQIETATSSCSVALAKNGYVLAEKQVNQRNIHAEVITLFIDELVGETGVVYQDIDAVAVSSGPGSYTGLRIGVATAKGLCFALDKPLIAIETLEGMAYGIRKRGNYITEGMLLCPMIDARRMEVFTAVFNGAGDRIEPTAAEIITEDSFSNLLKTNKILFFGDGAEKCRTVLDENPNAYFTSQFINSAADLTECALAKFKDQNFEAVAYFEPYYLKEFIVGKKAKPTI
jgi:tRNA threonylcarbamoyladenosine biosynthesis protein TsaB